VSPEAVLDVASWALLVAGGFFVFVGGVGALRMPDIYTRMHAAGLTDTLGTLLTLSGLILQAGLTLSAAKLLAIMLFLLLTAPTAAYALANAARLSGLAPERSPEHDEA
jgi:multicomponent Na+:H+ antiporter subunit G